MMTRKKIPKKRKLNNLLSKSITKFPGTKSDILPVVTENPLESDFCYHLEFDNKVIKYESQPLGFLYWFNGSEHNYTADFEAFFERSSCYYEIIDEKDISRDKEFEARFEAKKKAARELNKDLILLTDSFIVKQFRYENLCLLYKFSKLDLDSQYLQHIQSILQNNVVLSIDKLLRDESRNLDFQQIYRFIWGKILLADLDKEVLSINTFVQLSGGCNER